MATERISAGHIRILGSDDRSLELDALDIICVSGRRLAVASILAINDLPAGTVILGATRQCANPG